MVALTLVGLILLIAFLCLSQAIPEIAQRKPVSDSTSNRQLRQKTKK